MFRRAFFTLRMAWRHRAALKQYARQSRFQVDQLSNIDCSFLKSQGIKVLVLDFDGVLASHGESTPSIALFNWLKESVKIFGEDRVFILSNKATDKRCVYFEEHFPGIIFIKVNNKKPYPDGLLYALTSAQASAHELLIVDDRLLTGILAAILIGAEGRLIIRPFIHFRKRPIVEAMFWLLRKGERWIF